MSQSSTGLPENLANFIAYLFGWVSGLLILLVEKENQAVRYHGAQSVTVFGALTALNLLLPFLPAVGPLLLGLVAPISMLLWIGLMAMSLLGSAPRLPVVEGFALQLLQKFGNQPKRLD